MILLFLQALAKVVANSSDNTVMSLNCDFSFRWCLMGFCYGVSLAVLWRSLKGRYRKTPWPLAISCWPKESNCSFRNVLQYLADKLIELGISNKVQITTDWTPSARHGVLTAFPGCVRAQDFLHLRRAHRRNQISGKRGGTHPAAAKAQPKASPRGQAIAEAAARSRARPPPHLQHRSIEVWLALCAKLMWDDGRFAACFQQQYLYHASEPAALYGDGNMLRATWWSGTASALTPGHASSSQPQESFHAKMKRDLKSLEPLQDHMALVTMLERCVNLWSEPLQHNTNRPMSLMPVTGEGCVMTPSLPDDWMRLPEAKPLRKPWGTIEQCASVPLWLKCIRRGMHHETHEIGEYEWYVMAVAKPKPIPKGLAPQMTNMVRMPDRRACAELVVTASILERTDHQDAPYTVMQDRLALCPQPDGCHGEKGFVKKIDHFRRFSQAAECMAAADSADE